jgi:hypothetical protein
MRSALDKKYFRGLNKAPAMGPQESQMMLAKENWCFDNVLVVAEWWATARKESPEDAGAPLQAAGPQAKAWALLRDFESHAGHEHWACLARASQSALTVSESVEAAEEAALEALSLAHQTTHVAGGALIFSAVEVLGRSGEPVVHVFLACPKAPGMEQASARAARSFVEALPDGGWWVADRSAAPSMPSERLRLKAAAQARDLAQSLASQGAEGSVDGRGRL